MICVIPDCRLTISNKSHTNSLRESGIINRKSPKREALNNEKDMNHDRLDT
jgi:hypothetical protein